ncbi:MAG: PAS domain-containing protein [Phormidesmis sp.]
MNVLKAVAASDFKCDFQHLVSQTIEIMACYGSDCRYRAVSPALTEILQCSAETLVGKTDSALAQMADQPADLRAYWQAVADALSTFSQSGQAARQIHAVPTAAGLQYYETTYTPLRDSRDQLCQILSISRAIAPPAAPMTALVGVEMPGLETASLANLPSTHSRPASYHFDGKVKKNTGNRNNVEATPTYEMAEFMQIVLDSIPQYIFWKNRDCMYLGSNRRWAEMAGLGDPNNVVGITDNDLPWTSEQKDWYAMCDRKVMETDTPMLRIEQSQRQANGELSWRETSKFPLHDTEGNVVGLLGTIEDITERKISEDLLKQSVEKFQNLAKQGELLNQISTQIRQSLELESIQQITVNEVRQLFSADRVFIYRFDLDGNDQVAVESVTESGYSILGNAGMNGRFHHQYIEQYQEGQIRALPNLTTADLDAHYSDYLQILQVQASLTVPILVQDTLWGLLIAHQCSKPRDWEDNEINLLLTLAGQVGVAIHQSTLFAQTESSAAEAREKAHQLEENVQALKRAQAQLIQTEKMSSLGQMVAGIAHEINNPVGFIHGNLRHVENYIRDPDNAAYRSLRR